MVAVVEEVLDNMFTKKNNKLGTVLGVILFIIVIYFLSKHSHLITEILHDSGAWAPIVAVILYPLLAPTPITTDPITVIMGVTYGPLMGAVIAFFGNNLAALVEYYLGSKIGTAANFKNSREKMPFGLGKLPADSTGFLIFGRMIPGYGGKIISILAGTYRVPIKKYIWTTAVTNFLGSAILAYGGFGLVETIKFTKILKTLGI